MKTVSKRRGRGEEYAKLVLSALESQSRPLSAYEILAALRERAQLAPQTIYRALDRLIKDGHAHKLESLNAFTACTCAHGGAPAAFVICDNCGSVSEFVSPSIAGAFRDWSSENDFALKQTTLELHGTCSTCQQDANSGYSN